MDECHILLKCQTKRLTFIFPKSTLFDTFSSPVSPPGCSGLIMYLENKSNLEMEMSQATAQGHQARNSLCSPEAVAGNFGELRLLQGISESRDTQKLQQSAVLPAAGQCVIHTEGFVPVRQDDGYVH